MRLTAKKEAFACTASEPKSGPKWAGYKPNGGGRVLNYEPDTKRSQFRHNSETKRTDFTSLPTESKLQMFAQLGPQLHLHQGYPSQEQEQEWETKQSCNKIEKLLHSLVLLPYHSNEPTPRPPMIGNVGQINIQNSAESFSHIDSAGCVASAIDFYLRAAAKAELSSYLSLSCRYKCISTYPNSAQFAS